MSLLRSCTTALATALEGGAALWSADLFQFMLIDGVTNFYWSAWDGQGVEYAGNFYVSQNPWLTRSKWSLANTMEVPSLDIDLRAGNGEFNGAAQIKEQLHNGLFDGATMLLSRAYMTSPGSTSALGAMASKLLIFLRASTISPTSAAVLDALGNSFTSTGNMTKSTSDSNFNNHESITFNASTFNPYVSAAGGIGIGAAPQPMTNSFTVLAGMRCAPSSNTCLYGDNAGTSDSINKTGLYMSSTGKLSGGVGNSGIPANTSIGFPSSGQAGVVWISYDAATSILRTGVNDPAVAYQSSALSATRNGAGTSTVCYPFGFQTGGASGALSFHRWALFNKAFMNGSVPGDDAQFGALVSLYSGYI